MAAAVLITLAMVRDGHSRRWEGRVLVATYGLVVLGFLLAGDR
jgi:Ca2+/H+ antiporter